MKLAEEKAVLHITQFSIIVVFGNNWTAYGPTSRLVKKMFYP